MALPLAFAGCLCPESLHWWPPGLEAPPRSSATFYDRDLLTGGESSLERAVAPREIGPERLLTLRPAPGLLPGADGACLLSAPRDFHDRELGLRLSYCGLPASAADLERTVREIRSGFDRTALPEWSGGNVRLRPRSYSELQGQAWSVAVVCNRRMAKGTPQRYRHAELELSCDPEIRDAHLPTVFPGLSFDLLVDRTSVILLYPTDKTSHGLAIEISEPSFHASLLAGLQRMPQHLRTLHELAEGGDVTATETGGPLADVGLRNGFLEVAHDRSVPVRAHVRLIGTTATIETKFLVLPGGVHLLGLPPAKEGESIRLENVTSGVGLTFAGPGPTLQRTVDLTHSRASASCSLGWPCGSPGVHPHSDLLSSPSKDGELCSAEDVFLSEWNPFGVVPYAGAPPESGGKFVEIASTKKCRLDGLFFSVGHTNLDAGPASVGPDAVLVFAPESEPFTVPVKVSPHLRAAKVEDPITAVELASGRTFVLRPAPPGGTEYLPYATSDAGSERLHGLAGSCSEHVLCERFTTGDGRGLNAPANEYNAATPGFPNPGAHSPSGSVELTEILPAGARGPEGESLPAEEFVEFHAEQASGGTAELTISGTTTRRYRFVVPSRTGYFAFARDGGRCFADVPWVRRWPALSLPNGPGTYSLVDPGGRRSELRIQESDFRMLEGESRHSLTRVSDRQWAVASGPEARVNTCPLTFAAPGRATAYAPFLIETDTDHPAFTYFGTNALTANVEMSCNGIQSTPVFRAGHELSFGTALDLDLGAAPAQARCLLSIRAGTELLFVGDYYSGPPILYFDTIYPSPLTGEQEWVRVCTGAGFVLADNSLELVDSASADRIVPWQARGGAPLGPGDARRELLPGECALLLDPDSTALPESGPRDVAVWTAAAGAALGDGLAAGEGLRLRRPGDGVVLATFGLPDSARPFSIAPERGVAVRRVPGTTTDRATNYTTVTGGAP